MLENKGGNRFNKKAILDDLITTIMEITSGWEVEFEKPIGLETFLGADLAFTSVNLVRLVSSIQQQYSQKYIPFQELFILDNGVILQDIQVSHLVDFLYKHINDL